VTERSGLFTFESTYCSLLSQHSVLNFKDIFKSFKLVYTSTGKS